LNYAQINSVTCFFWDTVYKRTECYMLNWSNSVCLSVCACRNHHRHRHFSRQCRCRRTSVRVVCCYLIITRNPPTPSDPSGTCRQRHRQRDRHECVTCNTVKHSLNERHGQLLGGRGYETRELKWNDFRWRLECVLCLYSVLCTVVLLWYLASWLTDKAVWWCCHCASIGSSLVQVTTERDDNITRLLNVTAFTPRQYWLHSLSLWSVVSELSTRLITDTHVETQLVVC